MTQSIGNANTAEKIIELYAEGKNIPTDDKAWKTFKIQGDEAAIVKDALEDGKITDKEVKQFQDKNFSAEFIKTLRGKNGYAPLRARMKDLSDRRDIVSHAKNIESLTSRAERAVELAKAIEELEKNNLQPSQQSIDFVNTTIEQLESVLQNPDLGFMGDPEKLINMGGQLEIDMARLEAAKYLGKIGTPKAVKAVINAVKKYPELRSSFAIPHICNSTFIEALGNLPKKDQALRVNCLIEIIGTNSVGRFEKVEATEQLSNIVKQSVNSADGELPSEIQSAIACLEEIASSDLSVEERRPAIETLSELGIITPEEVSKAQDQS